MPTAQREEPIRCVIWVRCCTPGRMASPARAVRCKWVRIVRSCGHRERSGDSRPDAGNADATGVEGCACGSGACRHLPRAVADSAGWTAEQEAICSMCCNARPAGNRSIVGRVWYSLAPWRERLARWLANGGVECLERPAGVLDGQVTRLCAALDNLRRIAAKVQARRPGLPLHFDLAELRGYHYQTGLVFAAFVPGHGQRPRRRRGRYDEIGRGVWPGAPGDRIFR